MLDSRLCVFAALDNSLGEVLRQEPETPLGLGLVYPLTKDRHPRELYDRDGESAARIRPPGEYLRPLRQVYRKRGDLGVVEGEQQGVV